MARTLDVEKVAEPLFRVRLHEIFASMSSSQAADHSHPCKPECSFPPLLLLSQKTIKMVFWGPNHCRQKFREKCHFRGAEGELAEGQEKPPWGVSSEMTELNFIPSSACARRRVSERNRRKAAALSAEMTTELLAGGLF